MVDSILHQPTKIRAIETRYKGYRFRSRLEARYAVAFDDLGVKWEYEPEGYELGEAGRYLPDFFLPDLNLFIEVKGARPSADEHKKCEALANATGSAVFIANGMPFENIGYLYASDCCDSGGGYWEGNAVIHFGPGAVRVSCDDERVNRDRTIWLSRFVVGETIDATYPPRGYGSHAARSARFEHGARG